MGWGRLSESWQVSLSLQPSVPSDGFFTPSGDCFVMWPAEHGILDLATDQLCGLGQVTVALGLSCHLCKMIVAGVGRLFCDSQATQPLHLGTSLASGMGALTAWGHHQPHLTPLPQKRSMGSVGSRDPWQNGDFPKVPCKAGTHRASLAS